MVSADQRMELRDKLVVGKEPPLVLADCGMSVVGRSCLVMERVTSYVTLA